ncbi:hypothetical protein ACFFX0_22930 [Citricoccus parietis]|uniref:Uncharacterized protein n=1 Tax=Citricoccus parietis TaxID=592307 RepID=A0ABV5G4Q7_9MICC
MCGSGARAGRRSYLEGGTGGHWRASGVTAPGRTDWMPARIR